MSTAPQLEEPVEPVAGPVDGRTARAVRTRDGLVDATIALVEEGDLRPTAPRIAGRAGVSVRSVFQHFDDLDSLFAAVGARMVERLAPLVRPIDPTAPQAERIAEFVGQRCQMSEAVTPINRAAILHAPDSSTIGRQFAAGHSFARAFTEEVFQVELDGAGARRPQLLDGLIVASSWTTWNLLRTLEHRSVEEATAAVAGLVDVLVRGASR